MNNILFALLPVLAFTLAGCDNASEPVSQQADAATVFSQKAVWQGNIDRCYDQDNIDSCVIATIEKSGNVDAARAARYLAKKGEVGYLSGWQKVGSVGIAEVKYPFRANTNSETLLIPLTGKAVEVASFAEKPEALAGWQTFAKQHPDASPWPPGELIASKSDSRGASFVFGYQIRTCHACENIASAQVRYAFNTKGQFVKSELISIK